MGKALAVGRGVARAHDRDGVAAQELELAAHGNEGRGVIDRGKGARIIGLAPGDKPGAGALDRLHFAFGGGLGGQVERALTAAAPGDLGQGLERRSRRAIAGEELEERHWTDILAADEPQPIEPFAGGEKARLSHPCHDARKLWVPSTGSHPPGSHPSSMRFSNSTSSASTRSLAHNSSILRTA